MFAPRRAAAKAPDSMLFGGSFFPPPRKGDVFILIDENLVDDVGGPEGFFLLLEFCRDVRWHDSCANSVDKSGVKNDMIIGQQRTARGQSAPERKVASLHDLIPGGE
jgi:hypothetical protein